MPLMMYERGSSIIKPVNALQNKNVSQYLTSPDVRLEVIKGCAMRGRNVRATPRLLLEPEFLDERAICALVVHFQVLQVLAAIGNEAQKTATRMLILVVLAQMCRKFLNSTCQNGNLDLR
jgi:hypothetical protein